MVHQSRSSREHRRPSPAYAGERRSRDQPSSSREYTTEKVRTSRDRRQSLPQYNHNGHEVTKGMHPDGESGRKGFNPIKFLVICGRSSSKLSMLTNCLWPMVPVAIALHFARPKLHFPIFITSYIAMLPAANLLGFAGQELSRKMPHKAFAMVLETTFGSVVEIILFIVLLKGGEKNVPVIQAAVIGSILANILLCLGICFIAGGLKNKTQEFHEAVSESGNGLLLMAAMALVLPAVFYKYLVGNTDYLLADKASIEHKTYMISRGVAIISIIGYFIYVYYQTVSHDGLLHEIYEADDHKDKDRHEELAMPKLTLTEVVLALLISLACVALIAIFLVEQIPYIVEHGHVSDAFVGLILVPLVEKIAEHLLAIDEAYDNQINMALAHVMGASIQTALFNAPLTVLVGWGLKTNMNYGFAIFDAAALVLAVLVVGSFLRDGKSNYLEGVLCVMMYIIIAICAFYFPNPDHGSGEEGGH